MPTWSRRKRASLSSSMGPRSWLARRTNPLAGRSNPAMIIIMVDLPDPARPTTLTVSPRLTVRSMPRRMLTGPAALASFRCMSANSTIRSSRDTASDFAMGFPDIHECSSGYGLCGRLFNAVAKATAVAALTVAVGIFAAPAAEPVKILALGDSLTAGYGLPEADAFTTRLQKSLKDKGYDVQVINAGVSGDTTAGGRARLDWALGDQPQVAVVELGANDGLRGLDPG